MLGGFSLILQGFIQEFPGIWVGIACRVLISYSIRCGSTVFQSAGQAVCSRQTRDVPHGGLLLYHTQAHRAPQGLRVSYELGGECWVSNRRPEIIPVRHLHAREPKSQVPPKICLVPMHISTPSLKKTNLPPQLGSFCGFNFKAPISMCSSGEHNPGKSLYCVSWVGKGTGNTSYSFLNNSPRYTGLQK